MTEELDVQKEIKRKYRLFYNKMRKTTNFGKTVSHECGRRDWEPRFSMSASLLFSACMASESMLQFLPERPRGRLDHYSAANSCRMIIEHCIMLYYLTEENITQNEIDLRLLILHLHDASARYRIFKGIDGDDCDLDADIHRALLKGAIDEMRRRIEQNSYFNDMPSEKKIKLLGGQVLFLNGSRRAAEELGYDVSEYDALYSYLSTYAHGSPMSFYRAALWGVNSVDPAAGQIGVAASALLNAERSLAKAIVRMARVLDVNPVRSSDPHNASQ